jgi:hypothetical protein
MSDIGTISSFIGLFVTIFLLIEAQKIRKSFLRRARLPTITRELSKTTSDISTSLKVWSKDKNSALEQFAKIKGLLENIKQKLPSEEKKQINGLLNKLQPKRYWLFKSNISELTEDMAWDLYTDLNTVVTSLEQLVKDSKWD